MVNNVKWYSPITKSLVNMDFSEEEIENHARQFNIAADLNLVRAHLIQSYQAIPCILLYVYGSLKEKQYAHELMRDYILPTEKSVSGYYSGLRLYSSKNSSVHFPAGSLEEGYNTYCEVYLLKPDCIEVLDRYEGAPDLFKLEPFHEGYVYTWQSSLDDWESLLGKDHSW